MKPIEQRCGNCFYYRKQYGDCNYLYHHNIMLPRYLQVKIVNDLKVYDSSVSKFSFLGDCPTFKPKINELKGTAQ